MGKDDQIEYLYDIGLVYRSNHNYGANMTHFSLYSFLHSIGYKVLMIDLPFDSKYSLPLERSDPFELFMNNPYDSSSICLHFRHMWDLLETNKLCRVFIVGSDQLWRRYFVEGTNFFSTLDWVDNDKFKISYATSFGVDYYEGSKEEKENMGKRLSRINRISVRETSGIDIISEMTGRMCECVPDPVFICDSKIFYHLAEKGKEKHPQDRYIAAYILDEEDYKKKYIYEIKRDYNANSAVMIEDAMCEHTAFNDNEIMLIDKASIEEWLSMIRDCDYFITDSFHGMCFALIFEKQFIVTMSPSSHRGYSRIENLLKKIELSERIVCDYSKDRMNYLVNRKIDYNNVNLHMKKYINEGKKWIIDAINYSNNYDSTIQKQNREIFEEKRKILIQEKKEYERKAEKLKKKGGEYLKAGKAVYIWGGGDCFKKNIRFLTEIYKIDGVIDSNEEKWNKQVVDGIKCISPYEFLKQKKDVNIIILIERQDIIKEICSILDMNGLVDYVTYRQLFAGL